VPKPPSITRVLNQIRDLVDGATPGPITEINCGIKVLTEHLAEVRAAQIVSEAKLDAMTLALAEITATLGRLPATTFEISAEAVPATSPAIDKT
jgi:hypothetical protein